MFPSEYATKGEAYLEHFGRKGMKWGQRKDGKAGSNHRRALKVGAAATGAAVAVALLVRYGKSPTTVTSKVHLASGRQAAARVADQAAWKKNVSAVLKDMKEAHADQDRWMRGLGLGGAVNKAGAKSSKVDLGDISDVRRAWNDPNHVWDL